MRERGILFSSAMVRALLAGTKTQTRRVAKLTAAAHVKEPGGHRRWHPADPDAWQASPYGKPGDRLWVRETFMLESNFGLDGEDRYPPPFKDGRPIKRDELPDWGEWWTQAHYAATDPKPELCDDEERMLGWKPSIHMPRWASRITLELTAVRVERLQDISEADAVAEGLHSYEHFWRDCEYPLPDVAYEPFVGSPMRYSSAVEAYRALWESINGPGSWDANPWVWVLEFKRVTP